MCHDHDSRPPAAPRPAGEVVERGTLTLTAADGNTFAAAYAAPAGPARVGVVVLPDVRGLHPYYVALAERFAEAGLPVVALDWFGRTAELPTTGTREEDFDWSAHVPQMSDAGVDADVDAAVGYLRGRTSADLLVATVGSAGQLLGGCPGAAAGLVGRAGGFWTASPAVGDAADRPRSPWSCSSGVNAGVLPDQLVWPTDAGRRRRRRRARLRRCAALLLRPGFTEWAQPATTPGSTCWR